MAAEKQSLDELFHAIAEDRFSLDLIGAHDINECNEKGRTLLHLAALYGKTSTIKLLLGNGANVSLRDKEKLTPLHCAVEGGCLEAVEELSRHKDMINSVNNKVQTPLFLAVFLQKRNAVEILKMVEILICNGADIHLANTEENTPLHYAAIQGYTEIVKLLMEKGAVVDAKDKMGITPLHCAAGNNHVNVVTALLEAKADVNCQDIAGDTPLAYAAERGSDGSARVLIQQSADLNAKGLHESTPLHCAVQNNQVNVVKALLEAKANVNPQNTDGITPLHYAAKHGRDEIAKLLIQEGALLNAQDKNGATPLHYAAKHGRDEIAKLLIQEGALLNAQDKNGATPLSFATKNGSHAIRGLIQKTLSAREEEKKRTEKKEIAECLKAHLCGPYKYKIDSFSDSIQIFCPEPSAEISASIDSGLRLFCIYILLLEKVKVYNSKIFIEFNPEMKRLVFKNYKQEVDNLKIFLDFFDSEEHNKKFNTFNVNLETVLAAFAIDTIDRSGLQGMQWQYCKPNQSKNRKQKKPQQPQIQIDYHFNDTEFAKKFIEQLMLAEIGYSLHENSDVKITYPYSIFSDTVQCTQYCENVKKTKQLKIQKQKSTKKKKSEDLAQKEAKSTALQTPTKIPETSLVKAAKDNKPTAVIISLKLGQELTDDDKQKGANDNLPILVKQGSQFKMGEYLNGLWQEREINLNRLKSTTIDTLNQLKFTPRLTENAEISLPLINKLRESWILDPNIMTLKPLPRIKNIAPRTLQVDETSNKEDKKNILKEPIPHSRSTTVLTPVDGDLPRLTIAADIIIPPIASTTAPTTSTIDASYWQEGTASSTFFPSSKCGTISYNLDGTIRAPDVKPKKSGAGEKRGAALTLSRPDDYLRGYLREFYQKVDEDLIIRAIYYRVVQAFIPEGKLKSLRDKFAHQSQMQCFLEKNNRKRHFLLELANCFAKGVAPSDQRIAQMTQEIGKIETKIKDEEWMCSIVQELKALYKNFNVFLKEGNMPQFFNATQPGHSDACKASVIIIAECYKKMGEKPLILSRCTRFRNILAHESEYPQEPQMAGILAPSINEGDFRDLCISLSEIAKNLPESSSTTNTSASSSSSASLSAKSSL